MRATPLILAAVLAGTLPGTAPSYAGPVDGPVGRKCAFNATTDVTREAGWETGAVSAGPLYTGEPGTLHCRIVVNGGGTHSAPASVDESVRATAGLVAVMEPRPTTYRATAADDVDVCTSWVPDGGAPRYWVPQDPADRPGFRIGYWSTDPNDACIVTMDLQPNSPECSVWYSVDRRLGTDVAGIWQDCEGYEPVI